MEMKKNKQLLKQNMYNVLQIIIMLFSILIDKTVMKKTQLLIHH